MFKATKGFREEEKKKRRKLPAQRKFLPQYFTASFGFRRLAPVSSCRCDYR
jgi:hypothetical protein